MAESGSMSEFDQQDDSSRVFAELVASNNIEVITAVSDFDEKRHATLDAVSKLTAEINEAIEKGVTFDLLEINLGELGDSFSNLARAILMADGQNQAAVEVIVDIHQEDSDSRVKTLRDLVQCEGDCFEVLEKDFLRDLTTHNILDAENFDAAVEILGGFYAYDLQLDLDTWQAHISRQLESQPLVQTATIEIKKSPKEHVVDVLKIAAGVSIALTVDKLLRRK